MGPPSKIRKFLKSLKQDLGNTDIAMTNMQEALDIKCTQIKAELDETKKELQKHFEISQKRNENYLDLNVQFQKATDETTAILTKFKKETNNSLVAQDLKLKIITQYKS